MSRQQVNHLKPFVSIVIVITTMFTMVFFKMETRRMGYSLLKQNQRYQSLQDEYRHRLIQYAKITKAESVRSYAVSHLTLNEAQKGQIIQLTEERIALPQ